MYLVEKIKDNTSTSFNPVILNSITLGYNDDKTDWYPIANFGFCNDCTFSLYDIDNDTRRSISSIKELGVLLKNNEILGTIYRPNENLLILNSIKKVWFDLAEQLDYLGIFIDKSMESRRWGYINIRERFTSIRCTMNVSSDGAYLSYAIGSVFNYGNSFISSHILYFMLNNEDTGLFSISDDIIEVQLWEDKLEYGYITYSGTARYRMLNRKRFDSIVARVKLSKG